MIVFQVQCITEVEKRGMSEEGLYRLSGSERIIKDLKEKFLLGKDLHFVSQFDKLLLISHVKLKAPNKLCT